MKHTKKYAKILRARELRIEATEAEKVLWQYLRDRNFLGKKFRRQHIFRGFILDFYCPGDRLGIELDGSIHRKQKEYDTERQGIIEDLGIKILRFKNENVLTNIKHVLKVIKNHLTFPSPFDGEGR